MSAVDHPGAVAWSLVRSPYRGVIALFPDLTAPERDVCEAFPAGEWADLRLPGGAEPGREVRAGVIQALLMGAGATGPGLVPAVRLRGARITGRLDLAGGTVRWPLFCEQCEFTDPVGLPECAARTVSLTDCRLPGFDGTGMRLDGSLHLAGCTVGGPAGRGAVSLRAARISGDTSLAGSRITCPGQQALAAECAEIGGSLASGGLAVSGEVCLRGARVAGDVDLAGAVLANPGNVACRLSGATVAGDVDCDGMTASGTVAVDGASIGGRLGLDRATLDAGEGEALRARGLVAAGLTLRPAGPVRGTADLSQARLGVLLDDPRSWPSDLRLADLTYQALEPALPARERLRWLTRDARGHQAQPYRQLARQYAGTGQAAQARAVLLAGHRRQRTGMTLLPRVWGILQDVTVGYGYRPWRAVAWLAALLATGTAAYTIRPPAAVAAGAPHFHAFTYTLDLVVPVAHLGLRHAYHPAGAGLWLSYLLMTAGWVLMSAVGAAAVRALVRR